MTEGHLHKDVVLPFIVGIKCCGFYLYGTPLIYTQEVKGEQRGSMRASAQNPFSGSIVNMASPEEDGEFTLPRFSSVCPPGVGDEEYRRGSFLHENIDDETMSDPVMQRMPILKNITRRNLIPVIDFEELNRSSQANPYNSGLSNNSVGRAAGFKVNYLLVYLSSVLRTLSPESAASVLFTLPGV